MMTRRCVLLCLIAWLLSALAEEQCASDDGTCSSNKLLTIAVIGASTRTTGGLFMKKALDAGYRVMAIARTPSKIEEKHENLTVVQGDVKKPETIVEPLMGCDVVVGAFGHRAFSDTFKSTTLYSDGIKAVLDSMKQANVKRLIMLSSSGTTYMPGAPIVWDFMLRPFMWRFYADMTEMELIISETPDLNWTILRPPQLMDTKVPGTVMHSIEKPDPASTKWVAQVSREDLAQTTFDVMEQNLYDKKRVLVYTVP